MGRTKGSKNRIRKVPVMKIERVDSEEMPGDESELTITTEFYEEDEMLPIFDDNVLRAYKVGNYEKCIELIDRILVNNTDENKDHYKILSAASYTMSRQSFEEAHSLLDDVLRSNPLSSYAMYGKGVAFFFEKKLNESIEWLDKAIASSPGPEMDRARQMRVRADMERRTAVIVIRKMPQNEQIYDEDDDDDDEIDMLDDINLDFKELNDIKLDYIDMEDGDSQFAMVRRCSSPNPVEEIEVNEVAEPVRANDEVAVKVTQEELRNESPEEATQPYFLAEENFIEHVKELMTKPEILAPPAFAPMPAPKPPKPVSFQASAADEDNLQKTESYKRQKTESNQPEADTSQPEVLAPPPVAPKPAAKSPKPMTRRSFQASAADENNLKKTESYKRQKTESNQPEADTSQSEVLAPPPVAPKPGAKSPKPVRRGKLNTSATIEDKPHKIENPPNEPKVASKDPVVKAPLVTAKPRLVTAEEFFASGMEFYMSGNLKRSLKQFDRAINLDPTMTKADDAGANAQELLEMIDVASLNMNQKNYDIVVQITNDALEVDPTNLFINRPLYYQRGLAHLHLGNTESSMKDYSEFERLNKILLEN